MSTLELCWWIGTLTAAVARLGLSQFELYFTCSPSQGFHRLSPNHLPIIDSKYIEADSERKPIWSNLKEKCFPHWLMINLTSGQFDVWFKILDICNSSKGTGFYKQKETRYYEKKKYVPLHFNEWVKIPWGFSKMISLVLFIFWRVCNVVLVYFFSKRRKGIYKTYDTISFYSIRISSE